MSKEMREHIDTFKKFSLNENDSYTDKERKIIKLRELEKELLSSTINELIDSNNIDEMNKFVESDVISSKINEFFGGEMKDSMVPIIDRIINKLDEIKDEMTDRNRGTYNREDMIKIEFIDGLLLGKDMKLLLKSYVEQMKHRFH